MDVSATLDAHKSKFKSIQVSKAVPVEFDLGNLAVFDPNPLDNSKVVDESYLQDLHRDNVQLLLNEIFKLDVVSTEDGVMAQLPAPTTRLPREKPVPKSRPSTRWENFAKAKGITPKARRSKLVFDEEKGRYVPRWGYKGQPVAGEKGNNTGEIADDWLVEVKQSKDPFEDPRATARSDKKARIEKNESQRLRNIREAGGNSISKMDPKSTTTNPGEPFVITPETLSSSTLSSSKPSRKDALKKQIVQSRLSTASHGRFDKNLRGENPKTVPKALGLKRKRLGVDQGHETGNVENEKVASLALLDNIVSKSGTVIKNKTKGSQDNGLINVRKAVKFATNSNGATAMRKSKRR